MNALETRSRYGVWPLVVWTAKTITEEHLHISYMTAAREAVAAGLLTRDMRSLTARGAQAVAEVCS